MRPTTYNHGIVTPRPQSYGYVARRGLLQDLFEGLNPQSFNKITEYNARPNGSPCKQIRLHRSRLSNFILPLLVETCYSYVTYYSSLSLGHQEPPPQTLNPPPDPEPGGPWKPKNGDFPDSSVRSVTFMLEYILLYGYNNGSIIATCGDAYVITRARVSAEFQ